MLQYVGPPQKAERVFKVMSLNKGTSRGPSQQQSDGQSKRMNLTQGLSKDSGNAFAHLSDEGSSVVSTELKTPARNKSAPLNFKGGSAWRLAYVPKNTQTIYM